MEGFYYFVKIREELTIGFFKLLFLLPISLSLPLLSLVRKGRRREKGGGERRGTKGEKGAGEGYVWRREEKGKVTCRGRRDRKKERGIGRDMIYLTQIESTPPSPSRSRLIQWIS